MGSTTVITRNCAIAAGCARHDANFRADSLRCRSTPGRLPHAPGRSLGKRCRPRGAAGQDRPHAPGPWCCRRAALPAGCRRAARGAAGCRLPVNSRPVAPRSRPVTREALPARGAADVLRCRSTPGRLPHAPGRSLGKRCRPRGAADVLALPVTPGRLPHAPGRSLGSVAGPVVLPTCRALPVNSRPVAPRSRPVTREALPAPWCCRSRSAPRSRPVVLPTCCAPGRLPTCRPCRPRGAAGQLPAGCRAAGYLTVGGSGLRPNRGKSWPERHAMACSRAVRRPLGRQPAALTAGGPGGGLPVAIRAAGLGRLTFSIPVPIPAVAALPAAYKRAADAMPTLPTSHSCRDTSPSCRPLSSSSIAEKLPAGRAPDHTPIIGTARPVPRRSSGGPCRAARRLAAWSSGTAAGSGGLAAVLAFPVGKIGGPAAGFPAAGGRLRAGGRPGVSGREDRPRRVAGSGGPWRRLGSCQARWPQSAPSARCPSASRFDPLRL